MEITSQDPSLALNEFNAKIQKIEKDKNQPSSSSVMFWLLLFPPFALYKMWKFKSFHIWYPNLMIITAFLNIPSLLAMNTPASQDSLSAYKTLNLTYTPISTAPYFISTIIISVIEIIVGIYLRRKAKAEGFLTNSQILISLFLLIFQYAPLLIMVENEISSLSSQMPALNQFGY